MLLAKLSAINHQRAMAIRTAEASDWETIIDVYNEAIDTRVSTADTAPVTVESREQWLLGHSNDRFPIYVYERDSVVAGWCSLSAYRNGRGAFEKTVGWGSELLSG